MPPKSTTPAKKPAAKPAGATKAAPKSTTKPGAKPAASKPAGTKAPAQPEPKAEAAAPPAPKPIVFTEIGIKELDKVVIRDEPGTIKESGKWPIVVDENGLPARFLRHRDVNMLSVPDPDNMQPETIRKALIGAIKFGKPFILDMMEAEMYQTCVEQFDKILPGLLEMVINRSIIDDTYRYMQIVKDEDGDEYKNQYNYNIPGFSFLVLSQTAPSEELLRKMYPIKIV